MTIYGKISTFGDAKRQVRQAIAACIATTEPRSVTLSVPHEDVIALAERYGLVPHVASRADDDALQNYRSEAAARAMLQTHTANQVTADLAQAGIPCILLKGAAMRALNVGVELGDRHSDDVDVLVPSDRADEAYAALLAGGYAVAESAARPAVDGRAVAQQEVRAGGHSAPTLMAPTGVPIDLHAVIPDGTLTTFTELYPRTTLRDTVRVPTPPALFAQVCEHVVCHHQARPSYIARHTADLITMERAFGPSVWRAAEPFARPIALDVSRALVRLVRQYPRLAARVLFLPEPARIGVEIAWEVRDVLGRVRRDIKRDPRRLLTKLWPDPAYLAASYDTSVDDPRLTWLYLHRLLTLRWLFNPFYG